MVSVVGLFDVVGAVGFFLALGFTLWFYRNRPLYRNYWLSWSIAVFHLGLWAASETLQWLGPTVVYLDEPLQMLLLTVGLTAMLHIALYDNTSGERLLDRVRTSEARNSTLVEHYPDGAVVLFDDDLRVLMAGGEDLFGLAVGPDGVRGESVRRGFPSALAATLESRWRAAIEGEAARFELDRDGLSYEVRTLPVETDLSEDREGMMVVRNVTERERREQTLRERRDELQTLDRINQVVRDVDHSLVGARTRAEVARAVADRLAAAEPYRATLVASLEADGRLVPTAWSGAGGDEAAASFPFDVCEVTGPVGRAIDTGGIQVVTDVVESGEQGPWHQSARRLGASAVAVVPVGYQDRTDGVIAVYADRADAFDERELSVLDQFSETVGYAVTAIERRERADVLAALHGITRDLLRTETPAEVGEVVVEAATDLLDVEIAVFLYDEDDQLLKPVVSSEDALAMYEDPPVYGGGDQQGVTWQTYVTGETAVFDDVRAADSIGNPDTDARGAMFVPLGDHGVLAAGSTDVGAFDEHNRQLVDLLAATTEAAFDRLESEADLRERETQLREQNRALRHLQRINDVIRDVDQALVGASSRTEIEQSVCDRLTADGRFAFAWIGERRADDGVVPRTWAGDRTDYLDAVTLDPGREFPEPTARTAVSGEPTVVAPIADYVREASWASQALDAGYRSAVSVPIVYREIEYGVLTVYASSADEFDEQTTAVLSELAETVAYAIDARETKRGLLASRGTELELRVRESTTFLNEVATLADGPVTVVETRPASDDASRVYFEADGVSLDALAALRDRLLAVEAVDAVSDRAGEQVFRARVTGGSISDDVVELGAIPRDVTATADETTLVVSLFPHVDAREFVDRLRDRYSGVDLVARREHGDRTQTRGTFLEEFESRVTDRQLEVLRVAYESGYFESPRESTGEDVADRLGVSQPTVNHHLRSSQRRLLAVLFGERDDSEERRRDRSS